MRLPDVWSEQLLDYYTTQLKLEAARYSRIHQLPNNLADWKQDELRMELWKLMGVQVDHTLDLDIHFTGEVKRDGYTIRKLYYQSRKCFYVTALLFVPHGKGPFPAVLNMHGHVNEGHVHPKVQERGHILAKNGYVCLSVDTFGAGERSREHGNYEYHGNLLGGCLINYGETLLGIQLVDNMRGIDLLQSLPYVDPRNIGATGASGGGTQTLWVTAMDTRIKASIPVCSIGTFEAYITCGNCICETLPYGITLCEKAHILALAAPRALKIETASEEGIGSFKQKEMLRSFYRAIKIYELYGAKDKFYYQIYQGGHGYWEVVQEDMLGWFNLHLKDKGCGMPVALPQFELLTEAEALVFEKKKRPEGYCFSYQEYYAMLENNASGKQNFSKKALEDALKLTDTPEIINMYEHSKDGCWRRFTIETADNRLIPVLLKEPRLREKYIIVASPVNMKALENSALMIEIEKSGNGIVVIELWGTRDYPNKTLDVEEHVSAWTSRWLLWLGHTIEGKWIQDYRITEKAIRKLIPNADIAAAGQRDSAIAALLFGVLRGAETDLYLEGIPESLNYSDKQSDFNEQNLTMLSLIPGILKITDIPELLRKLNGKIININPN